MRQDEKSTGEVVRGPLHGPLRFWVEKGRHRMRWLLWAAATACGLGGANAPGLIAPLLRGTGLVLFAAGVVAWWFERRAFRLLMAATANAERAWNENAAHATAPDWIEHDTFYALAEPDFWLVAEQQLLHGDWAIDKYLDQEWKIDAMPLVEKFYDVTADEKTRAPRSDAFVATPAPKEPPRAIEPMEYALWPRCCGVPTAIVAVVDGHGRRVGDLELPFLPVPVVRDASGDVLRVDLEELPKSASAWPVWPGLGLECTQCGGRYAAANPDFVPDRATP